MWESMALWQVSLLHSAPAGTEREQTGKDWEGLLVTEGEHKDSPFPGHKEQETSSVP